MSIKVLNPGLLTTIQDLGRYGYQKHGIIVSGAMDAYSLRLANFLVGNEDGEAAIEITLIGPSLEIGEGTLFAITGGDLSPTINGVPVPMWRPVYLHKKGVLQFGASKSGCRSYLAVAGGYNVPEIMGSKSTYLRAGIGGFKGRALQKNDVLQFRLPKGKSIQITQQLTRKSSSNVFVSTDWYLKGELMPQDLGHICVGVIRDRQFQQFTLDSKNQFFNLPFKITSQSDRMGYRLSGPNLKLQESLEMISEGVSFGTIQVPPDGNPIILLADRQTIGGYPKIAQVAAVDISKVVQSKPGDKILFQEISLEEAEKLYIEREKYIGSLRAAVNLKFY
ncbi:biotin-dependent carboxyltransferase family protein [Clostridium sp. DJ247]|uniref:5-oxoprolinase subunit C family protein n=1 Tax=Clostridium sp. DJ247 TaxID=2726188 RepID=UPI001623FC12|nr:biotin-dependent carboxyltransferase family protein [Clostridium sp. DJ247]MBC2581096.1 biotin-dependent carboxyltransferase family protein [Clostridium sp. DJ247]